MVATLRGSLIHVGGDDYTELQLLIKYVLFLCKISARFPVVVIIIISFPGIVLIVFGFIFYHSGEINFEKYILIVRLENMSRTKNMFECLVGKMRWCMFGRHIRTFSFFVSFLGRTFSLKNFKQTHLIINSWILKWIEKTSLFSLLMQIISGLNNLLIVDIEEC